MATISTNTRRKNLFLGAALGTLAVANFCMGEAKASWSAPRCAAQCRAGLFAGEKVGGSTAIKRVAPDKLQKKASDPYKDLLNACAANCDPVPIRDALVANYGSLNEDNQAKLQMALKSEITKKRGALQTIQTQLSGQGTKKLSSSKRKDLQKKERALNNEINTLENQNQKTNPSLAEAPLNKTDAKEPDAEVSLNKPKVNLEKGILEKIAHPEGKEFVEPIIPEIEGFSDDPATTMQQDGKTILTKWGIVRILQATGIVVKRDPKETKTVEGSVKVKGQAVEIIKPLGKEDAGKIIANNPEPKQGGNYSEAVYFIDVNPEYLTGEHKHQTHYVLKKNRWDERHRWVQNPRAKGASPQMQPHIIDTLGTQNTPAKELIDLKKVRAYIVPQLKNARYAKIATIGESAFYFGKELLGTFYIDKKDQSRLGVAPLRKHYFVVLEAADGTPLENLFKQRDTNSEWYKIMFNVGRAVGELHGLLSDPATHSIPLNNLRLEDIKTIPHGDLHMGNMFCGEKCQSVTFIDTGSMADSLRSKGSPIPDLQRLFGTVKYLMNTSYQFGAINGDFEQFIKGYAQGFTQESQKQQKLETLLGSLFKKFSNDFAENVAAETLERNQTTPVHKAYTGLYDVNFFSDTTIGIARYNNRFRDLATSVFHDSYVSQSVKEKLRPILENDNRITREQVDLVLGHHPN